MKSSDLTINLDGLSWAKFLFNPSYISDKSSLNAANLLNPVVKIAID
ncbi:MAG TPA: hypothetical protein VK604_09980 [Bryobacteraceae bacterium]|nr:hypothetical protein [Bryobacteraceae bacterium]